MPRDKRLHIPGTISHVISRGIERRKIFLSEEDRENFIMRLEEGLKKTGCKCYAWSLLPNHFHLLIRTSDKSISDLMRKIMSGYATSFNYRHRRAGHLFQINPLRARIVVDMNELNKYPWSGHSVIIGKKKRNWQMVEEVLCHFGDQRRKAIKGYKAYVIEGIKKGLSHLFYTIFIIYESNRLIYPGLCP